MTYFFSVYYCNIVRNWIRFCFRHAESLIHCVFGGMRVKHACAFARLVAIFPQRKKRVLYRWCDIFYDMHANKKKSRNFSFDREDENILRGHLCVVEVVISLRKNLTTTENRFNWIKFSYSNIEKSFIARALFPLSDMGKMRWRAREGKEWIV